MGEGFKPSSEQQEKVAMAKLCRSHLTSIKKHFGFAPHSRRVRAVVFDPLTCLVSGSDALSGGLELPPGGGGVSSNNRPTSPQPTGASGTDNSGNGMSSSASVAAPLITPTNGESIAFRRKVSTQLYQVHGAPAADDVQQYTSSYPLTHYNAEIAQEVHAIGHSLAKLMDKEKFLRHLQAERGERGLGH